MGAKKHIKAALIDKGLNASQYADLIGMQYQAAANKLSRDNMSFKDAERIADLLNCDIVFIDRESGKQY